MSQEFEMHENRLLHTMDKKLDILLDGWISHSDRERIHRLARQSAHLAEAAKALAHLANMPVAPTIPPDAQ